MKDSTKWKLAMQSDMTALEKNQTWKLVNLPQGKKVLSCKWVYNYKITAHDCQPKYKARLVAKGFKQKKGIGFDEVVSPVVKMTTLRCFLALVAKLDLELHQMDVKTAFLHGDLNEEIYMQQPEGFIEKGKEALVCRLLKSLYELKHSPQSWYHKFHQFMLSQGYKHSKNLKEILALKSKMAKLFDMKDMGEASHILGMHFQQHKSAKLRLT
ncbi:hypothetical protein L7F22_064920 [Adiantum nelumboides]|nr:hypothetical protein [Adiantum nelumboides]MCO5610679.1 hypothetical protein [Adiantum nelumboides]